MLSNDVTSCMGLVVTSSEWKQRWKMISGVGHAISLQSCLIVAHHSVSKHLYIVVVPATISHLSCYHHQHCTLLDLFLLKHPHTQCRIVPLESHLHNRIYRVHLAMGDQPPQAQ